MTVSRVEAGVARRGAGVPAGERPKLVHIDTLRGIAILLVIIVHHRQIFTTQPYIRALGGYGQLGVQLFFVASAFTLCHSFHGRRFEPNPHASFYIRRFFRIAPLYYIGLVLYAGLSAVGGIGYPITAWDDYTVSNVAANILFIHGFVPSAVNSIVPGGWSIAVEMSFYLAFPLLFHAAAAAHERWGMTAFAAATACALALNGAVQLALTVWLQQPLTNNGFAYFNLFNQLPVFLVGMAVYFAVERDDIFHPKLPRDGTMFVILSLVSFGLLRSNHPIGYALLPTMAAVSFAFLFNIARAMVTREGLVERIGQASFSMYLFHFLFAWSLTSAIRTMLLEIAIPELVIYAATLLITVALTYVVALASRRLLETGFTSLANRWIAARAVPRRTERRVRP